MKPQALSISLGAVLAAQAAFAVSPGANNQWSLPQDILGTSNEISFNQGARDVWYFMESTTLAHDPMTYRFLPNYSSACPTITSPVEGLACRWDTAEPSNSFAAYPHVGINFHNQAVDDPARGDWPAHTLILHPQSTRFAIIAWRSPRVLTVNIKGAMNSLYSTLPCGDGVRWRIEKGTTILASGDTARNSNAGVFSVKNIKMKAGEALYVIADPKANDFCDSTKLSLSLIGTE